MKTGSTQMWKTKPVPMIEQEFLADVLTAACDIGLIVSGKGRISSVLVKDKRAGFGNLDHWAGRQVQDFLTVECVPKFNAVLDRFNGGEPLPAGVELNHVDNAKWQFPIRYSMHRIGHDGQMLMLGQDLSQVAEAQKQLVQAQVALERGYEERREFDARYRMLMAFTRDAFVLVSVSDGRIRDLNAAAASLLGVSREDLQGATLAQEFQDRKRGEFVENLLNVAMSEADSDLNVVLRRSGQKVSVVPTMFRAAGERLLLCRLDPPATAVVSGDRLDVNLAALFRNGADAMVFTDPKGVIEAANEAFVDMVDFTHLVELKGRSLADFLGRGQIDMTTMLESAVSSGHMRTYATKLTNDFGTWTSVEISVSYLNNRAKPAMAFMIRDVGRAEAMRPTAAGPSEESVNRNVVELVGSTTLKDIVAETTDVIEEMCIETALELTRNNRAAAAEMLGLSRQSLYVKLRKYDLLAKDT
jgi:transcriptional regulator PpsR